jgi:hypothetical protein
MSLEIYGLGTTFPFCSFFKISYDLRAYLNLGNSDFSISRVVLLQLLLNDLEE